MNRRGGAPGRGILFFVFFAMMLIIGGGLAGGVYAFFGKGYGFHKAEAVRLNEQVVKCFKEHNFFDESFTDNKDKFFEVCKLSKEVLEDGRHLVLVREDHEGGREFFVGVYDFKTQCFLRDANKEKTLPSCKESVIDGINILTGSNQNSRRVLA